MDVNGINANMAYLSTQKAQASQKPVEANETEKKPEVAAEFIKSDDVANKTYNKLDRETAIAEMKLMDKQRMDSFNNLLKSMLVKQGEKSNMSIKDMDFYVSDADAAAAAKAIEDGGEYSVDAVAGRILDMAKSLAGGDPSKIDMLKNAVIKGFGEAEKAFGQKMPDITSKTYDAVMKGFDEWANEGKTEEVPEKAPEKTPEAK